MDRTQAVIDQACLRQSERLFRERVEREPDDINARMSLAWCLFLQALHQAGCESVARVLVTQVEETETADEGLSSLIDNNAHALLQEALRQAATVRQLSARPQDTSDVSRLQNLASLSGAGEIVAEAEQEADDILTKLISEILPLPPARLCRNSLT